MKQIKHMCVNIAGLLRTYGRKKMDGIFTDDDGNEFTDKAARQYLAECQAKGWVLMLEAAKVHVPKRALAPGGVVLPVNQEQLFSGQYFRTGEDEKYIIRPNFKNKTQ